VIIIKVFVPSYFKKFRCISDKCPDTCCAGWEVNLDPESADYYKTVSGDIGKKLRSCLCKDEDEDDMFALCENRCPFLNKDNLCELILNLGEKSISKTCTLFPRFYDNFGSFREMGLGFGCPEAARLLLEDSKPFRLELYEETDEDNEAVDEEFLSFILSLRERIISVLESKNGSFKEKISDILVLCEDIQRTINGKEDEYCGSDFDVCINVLSDMEYIDEKRKNTLLNLSDKDFDRKVYVTYENDFIKLMKYYIFRYLLKSVYDSDILTKIKYGVFACAVIGRLYSNGIDRIKAMYGYSKEIEYSDINMQILDDAMYEDFGITDLINLF